MTGDVVSIWGDVMSTPLGDVTSGDAMSSSHDFPYSTISHTIYQLLRTSPVT